MLLFAAVVGFTAVVVVVGVFVGAVGVVCCCFCGFASFRPALTSLLVLLLLLLLLYCCFFFFFFLAGSGTVVVVVVAAEVVSVVVAANLARFLGFSSGSDVLCLQTAQSTD